MVCRWPLWWFQPLPHLGQLCLWAVTVFTHPGWSLKLTLHHLQEPHSPLWLYSSVHLWGVGPHTPVAQDICGWGELREQTVNRKV